MIENDVMFSAPPGRSGQVPIAHNPAMFSAPPGRGSGATPVSRPFSVLDLLTGDPNAVEHAASVPLPAPRVPLTGNPQQDAIAAGRPIITAHPTGTLGGLVRTVAPALGLRTDYSLNPNDPNGLRGAGEMMFPGLGGKAFAADAERVLAPEEAAAKVIEASKIARAKGYGRAGAPEIPQLKPGEVTAETGGETGAQVRAALEGAPKARTAQKELYRAERAQRFGKAESALDQENPSIAFPQALGHFKGELPKIDYQGFKEFNADTLNEIATHLKNTDVLSVPQKVTAWQSLQRATEGKVPTAGEQRLFEKVFGRETTQGIVQSVPFWKKLGHGAAEILNVPRAIQSAFDLSAPFRQGLVASAAHPGIFFSEFKPMLKAATSEPYFQGIQQAIRQMPTYPLMEQAKLSLTDIGKYGKDVALSDREEQFMSNLADRIPGVGHGVRFSERAYVGFLNKLRADLFNDAIYRAAKNGVDVSDPNELESIGKVVNAFTGRGDIGKLQAAAPLLNTVFFSPRLLASRLNLIFGVGKRGIPGEYYASLSPFARREALLGMRNLLGGLSTALLLAKMSGAQVGLDPTNADFAKIKIGNTRFDLAGGFQQPVRLMAQLFSGHITSSTTGKTLSITQHGYGKLSRKDILQRFVESKYAPVPSAINDLLSNKNFQGQPLKAKSEAYSHLVPLLAQDVADLERQYGPLAAVGGAIPGAFGVGLQTYGNQPTGGLQGPTSPPAHSDSMFSAPPGRGTSSPITHNSSMFSAPPGR